MNRGRIQGSVRDAARAPESEKLRANRMRGCRKKGAREEGSGRGGGNKSKDSR